MQASALAVPVNILPLTVKLPTLLAPKKRNICVFDPKRMEHYGTLRKLLGGVVNLLWFERFSKPSLEAGELSQGIGFHDVESLNPAAIIVELEVVSMAPDWRDGIRLLENFRRSQRFNTGARLIVISNRDVILNAHKEFERLNVDSVFTWEGLSIAELRNQLLAIVRERI